MDDSKPKHRPQSLTLPDDGSIALARAQSTPPHALGAERETPSNHASSGGAASSTAPAERAEFGGALELADSLDFSDLAETSTGNVALTGSGVTEVDADEFSFALSMLDEQADDPEPAPGPQSLGVRSADNAATVASRRPASPETTTLNPAANDGPRARSAAEATREPVLAAAPPPQPVADDSMKATARRDAMTAKTSKNLASAAAIALATKLAEDPWDDDNDAGQTVPAPPDYEAQARAVKQTKLAEERGVALAAPRVPELLLPHIDASRKPPAPLNVESNAPQRAAIESARAQHVPQQLRSTATSTPAAPAAAPIVPSRNPVRAEPSAPPSRPRNSLVELRDLLSLGDYSGALAVAEAHLELAPDELEAKSARNHCRATLKQMYSARIGNMEATPVLLVPAEQLRWMSIDQRAAFLLHHIDGVSSYETILDICGMPELDALRLLSDLLSQRIIEPR